MQNKIPESHTLRNILQNPPGWIFMTCICSAALLAAITILLNTPAFNETFHILNKPLMYGDPYTQNELAIKAAKIAIALILTLILSNLAKNKYGTQSNNPTSRLLQQLKKLPALTHSLSAWLLILLTAITLFLTLQIPGAKRIYYFDTSDSFHYFLMPKYADALSYFDVYKCSLVATQENGGELPEWFRRLEDTETLPVSEALTPENRAYCHNLFKPERWSEFKQDLQKYAAWAITRSGYNRFHDHGYNGTPVFTLITYSIANSMELNELNLTRLSLTNLLLLTLMFCLVALAFNWELAAGFCLLWAISHADRYFLGGAFLRYAWFPLLIMGLCCLKLKRPSWAGFLLCLSSLLQIFPALFLGAASIKIAYDTYKTRKLNSEHKHFLRAAAITLLTLSALTLITGKGIQSWIEFKQKMDVHSTRMASGRIGYLYDFLYPRERNEALTPYEPKYARFQQQAVLGPLTTQDIFWISILLFALSFAGLLKKTDIIEFSILTGFGLFFLLFSTVNYYYSGWLGIPLLLYRCRDHFVGRIYIALLFSSALYICLNMPVTEYHYPYNTLLSGLFTLLLFLAILFFNLYPSHPQAD